MGLSNSKQHTQATFSITSTPPPPTTTTTTITAPNTANTVNSETTEAPKKPTEQKTDVKKQQTIAEQQPVVEETKIVLPLFENGGTVDVIAVIASFLSLKDLIRISMSNERLRSKIIESTIPIQPHIPKAIAQEFTNSDMNLEFALRAFVNGSNPQAPGLLFNLRLLNRKSYLRFMLSIVNTHAENRYYFPFKIENSGITLVKNNVVLEFISKEGKVLASKRMQTDNPVHTYHVCTCKEYYSLGPKECTRLELQFNFPELEGILQDHKLVYVRAVTMPKKIPAEKELFIRKYTEYQERALMRLKLCPTDPFHGYRGNPHDAINNKKVVMTSLKSNFIPIREASDQLYNQDIWYPSRTQDYFMNVVMSEPFFKSFTNRYDVLRQEEL